MRSDRTVIYARVSTNDQSVQMQLDECQRLVAFRGWTVTETFIDQGVSGSRVTRPALEELMRAVRGGKVTRVLVWKLDRFGRNAAHLVTAVDELNSLGVEFCSMTEAFDTSQAMGRAMLTILAAVAQLERENIKERSKAGVARARREGKQIGRAKVCTPGEVVRLIEGGMSQRQAAKHLGVGHATVDRRMKEARDRGLFTPVAAE
jgi:DNA invertase Pin-like site-specific DNA recombinase